MKNDIKWKRGGGYCILLILGICLVFTISGNTQAFARTNDEVVGAFAVTDLGHGAGCLHSHISACNHTHIDSCYYQAHQHDTQVFYEYGGCRGVDCMRDNARCIVSKDGRNNFVINCPICGRWSDAWGPWGGGDTFITRFCVCGLSDAKVLVCSRVYDCGLGGVAVNCVTPSTAITRSTAGWTNQNVTCTGQCPTFTFTDGNPQTVVFTSSSGHRVQETIASNVDKLAPDMPTYQIE